MVKKAEVESLFLTFEKEIAAIESKKHKSEGELNKLSSNLKSLEKRQADMTRMLSKLMAQDVLITEHKVQMKSRLEKQTSKLEKLRMLYKDLKEV